MTAMPKPFEVAVIGAGVFTPRYPTYEAWIARTAEDEPARPTGELIEKRSRRRASELTLALADAYGQALRQSGVDPMTVPTVFGSALGEASTMIGLLDQMWREHEALSPLKFAMSVHNAASGAISISAQNRAFTTSLGADFDTVAMAITEAMAIVHESQCPVAVICGDDAVPRDIVPEDKAWSLVAAAVVLAPPKSAPQASRLSGPYVAELPSEALEIDGAIARNPNVGMLDLLDALDVAVPKTVRTDRGVGFGWCFDILPPA